MSRTRSSLLGLFTWVVALLFFTPVAWMVLTSLHSEVDAATPTPNIFAGLTLEGWRTFFGVDGGESPWPALINSSAPA